MSQETSTSESLTELLTDLLAGRGPAESLACGRAKAAFNTEACTPTQAAELARLAKRPLPGLTLFKLGSRSVVGTCTLASGERVVLKYYSPKSLVKHLSYGMRGSRCMQSWFAGIGFNAIGVPTPAPLVIAEWHRCGGLWLSRSFIATRPAEGIALGAFIRSHGADHQLAVKAAESLRRSFSLMAAHRAVHGDLKANNLILSESGEVSFIDLDAALFLVPETRWKSLHEKDRKRFHANWKSQPDAAALFRGVFDSP